jgi:uncharacterized protein
MTGFPMFPLGTVLVPTMILPLHVFEPRYLQLVRDVLDRDAEFGVVLIERGSEVGGGDVRTTVGTVARLVEVAELPDDRLAMAAVGMRRFRVQAWLDDDPYPRAEVDDWPDDPPLGDQSTELADLYRLLRRSLALHTELGDPVAAATTEISDDPVLAGYQMTALAPVGPADRQRLLAAESPERRFEMLGQMLTDELEVLEHRMGLGD